MVFTYVLSTDIGKVRLQIPDSVDAGHLFENDEIQYFLDKYDGNIDFATAIALEVISTNQVLLLKYLTLQDRIQTNGPAVAKELRERASQLRVTGSTDLVPQIASQGLDDWTIRDLLYREVMQ